MLRAIRADVPLRVRLPRTILVIDQQTDSAVLLVGNLARKFPSAIIQLCQDTEVALQVSSSPQVDVIVVSRPFGAEALSIIREVRESNGSANIVAVSDAEGASALLDAGADAFCAHDEWPRLGAIISKLVSPDFASAKAER